MRDARGGGASRALDSSNTGGGRWGDVPTRALAPFLALALGLSGCLAHGETASSLELSRRGPGGPEGAPLIADQLQAWCDHANYEDDFMWGALRGSTVVVEGRYREIRGVVLGYGDGLAYVEDGAGRTQVVDVLRIEGLVVEMPWRTPSLAQASPGLAPKRSRN